MNQVVFLIDEVCVEENARNYVEVSILKILKGLQDCSSHVRWGYKFLQPSPKPSKFHEFSKQSFHTFSSEYGKLCSRATRSNMAISETLQCIISDFRWNAPVIMTPAKNKRHADTHAHVVKNFVIICSNCARSKENLVEQFGGTDSKPEEQLKSFLRPHVFHHYQNVHNVNILWLDTCSDPYTSEQLQVVRRVDALMAVLHGGVLPSAALMTTSVHTASITHLYQPVCEASSPAPSALPLLSVLKHYLRLQDQSNPRSSHVTVSGPCLSDNVEFSVASSLKNPAINQLPSFNLSVESSVSVSALPLEWMSSSHVFVLSARPASIPAVTVLLTALAVRSQALLVLAQHESLVLYVLRPLSVTSCTLSLVRPSAVCQALQCALLAATDAAAPVCPEDKVQPLSQDSVSGVGRALPDSWRNTLVTACARTRPVRPDCPRRAAQVKALPWKKANQPKSSGSGRWAAVARDLRRHYQQASHQRLTDTPNTTPRQTTTPKKTVTSRRKHGTPGRRKTPGKGRSTPGKKRMGTKTEDPSKDSITSLVQDSLSSGTTIVFESEDAMHKAYDDLFSDAHKQRLSMVTDLRRDALAFFTKQGVEQPSIRSAQFMTAFRKTSRELKEVFSNADLTADHKQTMVKTQICLWIESESMDPAEEQDNSVENISHLCRLLPLTTANLDVVVMNVFLNDYVLKTYIHTAARLLGKLYDELLLARPPMLHALLTPDADDESEGSADEHQTDYIPDSIPPPPAVKPASVLSGETSRSKRLQRTRSFHGTSHVRQVSLPGVVTKKLHGRSQKIGSRSATKKTTSQKGGATAKVVKRNLFDKSKEQAAKSLKSPKANKGPRPVAETPANKQGSRAHLRHRSEGHVTLPQVVAESPDKLTNTGKKLTPGRATLGLARRSSFYAKREKSRAHQRFTAEDSRTSMFSPPPKTSPKPRRATLFSDVMVSPSPGKAQQELKSPRRAPQTPSRQEPVPAVCARLKGLMSPKGPRVLDKTYSFRHQTRAGYTKDGTSPRDDALNKESVRPSRRSSRQLNFNSDLATEPAPADVVPAESDDVTEQTPHPQPVTFSTALRGILTPRKEVTPGSLLSPDHRSGALRGILTPRKEVTPGSLQSPDHRRSVKFGDTPSKRELTGEASVRPFKLRQPAALEQENTSPWKPVSAKKLDFQPFSQHYHLLAATVTAPPVTSEVKGRRTPSPHRSEKTVKTPTSLDKWQRVKNPHRQTSSASKPHSPGGADRPPRDTQTSSHPPTMGNSPGHKDTRSRKSLLFGCDEENGDTAPFDVGAGDVTSCKDDLVPMPSLSQKSTASDTVVFQDEDEGSGDGDINTHRPEVRVFAPYQDPEHLNTNCRVVLAPLTSAVTSDLQSEDTAHSASTERDLTALMSGEASRPPDFLDAEHGDPSNDVTDDQGEQFTDTTGEILGTSASCDSRDAKRKLQLSPVHHAADTGSFSCGSVTSAAGYRESPCKRQRTLAPDSELCDNNIVRRLRQSSTRRLSLGSSSKSRSLTSQRSFSGSGRRESFIGTLTSQTSADDSDPEGTLDGEVLLERLPGMRRSVRERCPTPTTMSDNSSQPILLSDPDSQQSHVFDLKDYRTWTPALSNQSQSDSQAGSCDSFAFNETGSTGVARQGTAARDEICDHAKDSSDDGDPCYSPRISAEGLLHLVTSPVIKEGKSTENKTRRSARYTENLR